MSLEIDPIRRWGRWVAAFTLMWAFAGCGDEPVSPPTNSTTNDENTAPSQQTSTTDNQTSDNDSDDPPEIDGDWTFTRVYADVIDPKCNGCHNASHSTGLDMSSQSTAYGNLVSTPSAQSPLDRVEPNSADDSYLIHKLEGTQSSVGGSGARMPRSGCCLSNNTIGEIAAWIDAGAADD